MITPTGPPTLRPRRARGPGSGDAAGNWAETGVFLPTAINAASAERVSSAPARECDLATALAEEAAAADEPDGVDDALVADGARPDAPAKDAKE